MGRKVIFLVAVLLCMISFHSGAQPLITFESKHYSFEDYRGGTRIVFRFENTGNKPLALLTATKSEFLKIHFNRSYIQPQQYDSLVLEYYPSRTGIFKEQVILLSNAGSDTISISGVVSKVVECPDFNNPGIKESNQITFIVRDTITKNVIRGVNLKITDGTKRYGGLTDSEGKFIREIPDAPYRIELYKDGYLPKEVTIFCQSGPPYIIEIRPDDLSVMPEELYNKNNIVFLLDVSVSMNRAQKLNKLKQNMLQLVTVVRPVDKLSVITFSEESKVLLEGESGIEKEVLEKMIGNLTVEGKTYGLKGVEKAYQIAEKHFIKDGNNQLIIATDGGFNSPDFSEEELLEMIKSFSRKDIKLSVLGFGKKEENILRLEEIAKMAKGNYLDINKCNGCQTILIEEIKKQSRKKNPFKL